MIITHATWEKRNLNVNCNEITLEQQDSDNLDQVIATISENTVEYTVVKIPTGMTHVMFALENMGFHFIEGIICTTCDLRSHEKYMPNVLKKMAKRCVTHRLDETDFKRLFTELCKGIFDTDRIYLDPYFNEGASAERYIGWIRDAYKKGANIYEYSYNNRPFGFFQFKVDSEFNAIETVKGVYKSTDFPGAGSLLVYLSNCEMVSQGAKKAACGHISTNNPNSLRLHLALGYKYDETHYVYIKHIPPKNKLLF